MDSKNIEEKAINEVKRFFEDSSIIHTYITENDKEPFWDGHLYLYPSGIKTKENFQGRVPVQVKGKVLKKAKTNNFSYPIDIADLKAYLHEGVIFIVVQLIEKQRIIFYHNLSPILLRSIIAQHPNNKSTSIKMFPLSNSVSEVEVELLQFEIDCKKQVSSANSASIDFETLMKISNNTFSFSLVLSKENRSRPFFEILTSRSTYIYANINEPAAIQIPIGDGPAMLEIDQEFICPISIKGKLFYSSYMCKYRKDFTVICIGNCIELEIPKASNGHKPNINIKRNAYFLKDVIKETEYIIGIADAKEMTIGEITIQIAIEECPFINELRHNIDNWKELDATLCKIGVHEDINLITLSKKEIRNIELLIRMVGRGEELNLKGEIPRIVEMKISNLKLFLLVYKANLDKSKLKSLFDKSLDLRISQKYSDGEFPESLYGSFDKKAISDCSNFPYNDIIPSYEALMNDNPHVCERMNLLLLELLSAYDQMPSQSNTKELALHTATEMADWLIANDTNEETKNTNLLNKYQILKRRGNLMDTERQRLKLLQINNADAFLGCGIALLLDDSDAFDIYWKKMSAKEHAQFKNFPIWIFKK